MKGILKWLGGIAGTVMTFVLVAVLLPYAATLADYLLPDISGSHVKNAAILSQHMQESARLETLLVDGEGVISAEREAAFVGTVSSISVTYRYTGSYGIDLKHVQLRISGNQVVFILPQPELLTDSITMDEVYRDGILDGAVRFSDKELQELLEAEKQKFREQYLTGENAQALRDATVAAMDSTIAVWMSGTDSRLAYSYEWAAAEAE